MLAIEAENLVKFFMPRPTVTQLVQPSYWRNRQPIIALRDVSLSIRQGETVALLGPNGAGKTTLIKMLCNLILPNEGRAKINGFDLLTEGRKIRRVVGLVTSDERSFFWRLTGRANLEFFASLHDIHPKVYKGQINYWLRTLGIEKQADVLFKSYSSGIKKKIAIIRALLHEPEILFMDEASSCLDIPSMRNVQALLKENFLSSGRKTLIWATHRLEEIESINCRRIVLMNQGEVYLDESLERFRNTLKQYTRRVLHIYKWNDQVEGIIKNLSSTIQNIARRNGTIAVTLQEPHDQHLPETLFQKIIDAGGQIGEWKIIEPTFEEIFLTLINEESR